jgi:RNA polymerase sigma factor (sigma-70 family)
VSPDDFLGSIEPFVRDFLRKRRHRLLRHLGGDPDRLKDLTQELRLALWLAAHDFDGQEGDVRAFAETVLDRCVAKQLRHRFALKRYPSKEKPLEGRVADAPDRHAACDRSQSDLRLDLSAALESLSADDRIVAELLGVERSAEVSRVLGLTRARLDAAKRRMRQRFADVGLREYV